MSPGLSVMGRMRPARQSGQVGVVVPLLAAASLWWSGALDFTNFGAQDGRGQRLSSVQRRAATITFEVKDQPDVELRDLGGAKRLWYQPVSPYAKYQTVLGDEIPATGRHYWEVKILKKPVDAWECIGLVQSDPAINKDMSLMDHKITPSSRMFVAGTWDEAFGYRTVQSEESWNKYYQDSAIDLLENTKIKRIRSNWREDRKVWRARKAGKIPQWVGKTWKEVGFTIGNYKEKDWKEKLPSWPLWNLFKKGTSALMGTHLVNFPPFKVGTVVGIDVNMDTGTVGLWSNGEFYGHLLDTSEKPVNVKGLKVRPAISLTGRRLPLPVPPGAPEQYLNEYTLLEVRTGLEPPKLPEP